MSKAEQETSAQNLRIKAMTLKRSIELHQKKYGEDITEEVIEYLTEKTEA